MPFNRREALTRLGKYGIAAAAGVAVETAFKPGEIAVKDLLPQQPEKVYQSGEEINDHEVYSKIDGWNVSVDLKPIKTFTQAHPDEALFWSLTNLHHDNGWYGDSQGYMFRSDDSDLDRYTTVDENGRQVYTYSVLPFEDTSEYVLAVGKLKDGHLANQRTYNIEMKAYTDYGMPPDNQTYVISEVDIGENIGKISNMTQQFNHLRNNNVTVSPPRIYVFKSPSDLKFRSGGYDHTNNIIRLESATFTNPQYPEEGELAAWHNIAQTMYPFDTHIARSALLRAQADFQDHIGSIRADYFNSNPLKPGLQSLEDLANLPIFQLFTESSFLKDKGYSFSTNIGRPSYYDSELFTSAITIFKFFPDEFVKRFNNLRADDQEKVRNIVKSVDQMCRSMWYNFNEVTTLIPQYDAIMSAVQNPNLTP